MTDNSFFIAIHTAKLRKGEELPFSLYAKVGELYLLKIKGGSLLDDKNEELLKKLSSTQFYILDTDEPAYTKYLSEKLSKP